MKQTIDLGWTGNMSFETELDGHKLLIDASPESGGEDKGPRPKKLMLVALAGCTGMDMASMLKKMRVNYDTMHIKVEANMQDEHPKYYDAMKVIYEFTGENIDVDKVEKAAKLSMETYCGVSALYKKVTDFSYEIRINP